MIQEFGAVVLVPWQERNMPQAIHRGRLQLADEVRRGLAAQGYRPEDLYAIRESERTDSDGSLILKIKGKVGR